jgi:hypothetical protein
MHEALCDPAYDCRQKTCPTGNDITLAEWDPAVLDEVQELSCQVLPGAVTPTTFRLSFRGAVTPRAIVSAATVATGEAGNCSVGALKAVGTAMGIVL